MAKQVMYLCIINVLQPMLYFCVENLPRGYDEAKIPYGAPSPKSTKNHALPDTIHLKILRVVGKKVVFPLPRIQPFC